MTNDEAIYTLKNTAFLGWSEQAEKVSEAVQMAVEALKRETSGDAIDRQAAIRIASGYCHFTNVAKELEKLPSVQPVDKDINVSCKDAISRQDAIDAVDKLSDKPIDYLESAIDVLVDLPSVQPDVPDTNVGDLISRQVAIDICHKNYDGILDFRSDGRTVALSFEDIINSVPPVQPYTDEEIQKMQDMESAEIEKAFELGREDARAEIIHCGECKHKGTKNCVANVWTNVWGAILGVTVKDDFYCGLAERRTDGEIIPE